jgi:ribonuclease P protein component
LRDSDRLGLTSPAHAAALSNSQPTRIGISISQKVSKRAVDRNRIKRQIRAALQEYLPDLKTGWRIVIVVRPTAIQCDYQQFLQELKQLLIEAEVVNGYSGRSVF